MADGLELEEGVIVEATPKLNGVKGCWYEAEVLEVGAADALLVFTQLHDEMAGEEPVQEWHKRRELRPAPPSNAPSGFPERLERGDRLEFFFDRGWWEVTLLAVYPTIPGVPGVTEYQVRPVRYNDKHRVDVSQLRPAWTWRAGEWTVAYNSKARKVDAIGPPRGSPRRVTHSVLPPGVPKLERLTSVADGGGGGGGGGGSGPVTRKGIDSDGYGPPEARASSFAEGTERAGVDGRLWQVATTDNGSSVWTLPGQALFFIERARREHQERKERKRRESKAAAAAKDAAAKAAAAAKEANAAAAGGGGARNGGANARGGASGVPRELANVQCALDVVLAPTAAKKPAKGAARSAGGAADHDRTLGILVALLTSHGEAVLADIPDSALEPSDESKSGFLGVYGQAAADGSVAYEVQVAGRSVGRCDTAPKAARLRAAYVRIQAELAAGLSGAPQAHTAAIQRDEVVEELDEDEEEHEAPSDAAVATLGGQILGREAQLERQREYAHLVSELIY